jgi:hypothetical protein
MVAEDRCVAHLLQSLRKPGRRSFKIAASRPQCLSQSAERKPNGNDEHPRAAPARTVPSSRRGRGPKTIHGTSLNCRNRRLPLLPLASRAEPSRREAPSRTVSKLPQRSPVSATPRYANREGVCFSAARRESGRLFFSDRSILPEPGRRVGEARCLERRAVPLSGPGLLSPAPFLASRSWRGPGMRELRARSGRRDRPFSASSKSGA